jgi:hypothetical protein
METRVTQTVTIRTVEAIDAEIARLVTDTARRRLSAEITPLAMAWLETDAYTVSESLAYARMILETRENDRYGSTVREIRRQAEQYRDKLPTGVRNRLFEIADSYEALNRQRDNLSSMLDSIAAAAREA